MRVRIFGLLEARLQSVDRVVLGGLVEGVWPPETRADPWLSRPMRHELGLDLPERRIGFRRTISRRRSAHREVILTRAAKLGGAPTVASRFVQRLAAVAGEARWKAARERGERYLELARALDRPAKVEPAKRPAPKPPLAARPIALSVTEIEHWLRDPYTIYAKHILRLAPLDAVDTPPGAADRGTVIHGAIGDFTQTIRRRPAGRSGRRADRARRAAFRARSTTIRRRARSGGRAFCASRAGSRASSRARRAGIAKLHAEIGGADRDSARASTFTLTARADRIERLADGGYAILDYKTGQPPTETQVRIGLAPQLTLEAAILRRGGFPGHRRRARRSPSSSMSRCKGGEPAGEAKPIEFKDSTPDAEADRALEKLTKSSRAASRTRSSLICVRWSTDVEGALRRLRSSRAREGMVADRRRRRRRRRMSAPRDNPPDGRARRQIAASDPDVSAWVAANAGSGKTHVLAQRVIRLLLQGVEPARILCITFTKAAAANMANRVFDTLAPVDRARRRARSMRR